MGDPELEARRAHNFDLSGEYYFQSYDGFMSAALFYKKIDNEHFRQVNTSLVGGVTIKTSQVRDDSNADVAGLELNFIMNSLDFLPAPFNHFGVHANYTYSDGEWKMPRPVVPTESSTDCAVSLITWRDSSYAIAGSDWAWTGRLLIAGIISLAGSAIRLLTMFSWKISRALP